MEEECEGNLVCKECGSEMVVGLAMVWITINEDIIIPPEIENTCDVFKCTHCGFINNEIICEGCMKLTGR